jgi:drug/metabolite transporter (DMT)-like permease
MIQLPIIGALLEAAGMTFEKKLLKKKNFNYKNYAVYEFLAIVLVMLTFIFFVWRIDELAFSAKNIAIFAGVILSSIVANLLIFYSLKREDITEFEPVWLMQPIFTIILAFLFYSSERKWSIFILALIASVSLIVSHVRKHHLVFNKYLIAALIGGFFFAVELVLSKSILPFYSLFTFYFLRCLFVLIIIFIIYRPTGKEINKKVGIAFIILGLIWTVYRVIIYYGYEVYGIVFTTMLLILSPVFLFIFAVIFLKEKPKLRNIISSAIIIVCVVLAIFLGK